MRVSVDADDLAMVLPREPWPNAVGRYAAAVLGLMGVGAILNVVVGRFMEPMAWGGLLGFSLLAGGFAVWQERGSVEGAYRRRRIAPVAAGSFALYVLGRLLADSAELEAPTLSIASAVVFGAVAITVSAIATTRLARQVHTDPGHDSPSRRPQEDVHHT